MHAWHITDKGKVPRWLAALSRYIGGFENNDILKKEL